jgi:[ribosomal protein S18]-alanine N-acetyltransferase
MLKLVQLDHLDLDVQQSVLRLESCCQNYPWSAKQVLSCTDNSYMWFGALNNHGLIGFCIFKNLIFDVELLNICIETKQRKKGYATKLLDFSLNKLSDFDHCFLEVRQSNINAIALYDSLDFEMVSLRKSYYKTNTSDREDAIVMSKKLIKNIS